MGLSPKPLNNIDRYVRLCLYGPPGAGKTTWAAGAPRPVWLDFENSLEALRETHPEILSAGEPHEIRDYDNVLEFVRGANTDTSFDTIVVDTLSSMNTQFLIKWMFEKGGRDRHIAGFEDFRKVTNVMREIFTELITVRKHVIVICHEKKLKDEKGTVLECRPDLPPKTEESIEQLVNEALYMEKKTNAVNGTVSRTMTVSAEGKIFAKNRQGFEVAKIQEPTWEKIYTWA